MMRSNGREALNRLQQDKPDVILLDLMMPEMDGFAVVAALQKEAAWRDIPIVVITARDLDAKDRERLNSGVQTVLVKETKKALAAGCNEFDTKPIEFDRLVATVQRLLASHK